MRFRYWLICLAAVAGVVIAKTYGPFDMRFALSNKDIPANEDAYTGYANGTNLARLFINRAMNKIKTGDIIRVKYVDGVLDLEVAWPGCNADASIPCSIAKATQVSSVDAPSTPSDYAVDQASRGRDRSCAQHPGMTSIAVRTGRWGTTWDFDEALQTFTVTGGIWIDTGTITLAVPYVRPPSCV